MVSLVSDPSSFCPNPPRRGAVSRSGQMNWVRRASVDRGLGVVPARYSRALVATPSPPASCRLARVLGKVRVRSTQRFHVIPTSAMVGTPSALSSETVRSPFLCERSVESARSSRTVDNLACLPASFSLRLMAEFCTSNGVAPVINLHHVARAGWALTGLPMLPLSLLSQ